ncbi:hypothetical protein S40285_02866 [Stachybotrys chlorohalonatus IBT 40285]|uniref:Uncharacterized protein n=1 Tax=Stachybotrys chlorohalonatus (strain IBT 40285) TaxID=1283841 RepID=A0A084QLQ1_STAC4|nr:hypothetical protein S40285_02866 [Stachybotrys chlorohalonata IBT 40285]
MTDFTIEKLGISCPALSRFYVCPRSRFIGCCSEDPCVLPDGVCPQDRMQPTSFDMFSYNMIERHECVFADAQWYTCAYTSPPFLGCCTVNPCEVGECPLRSLRPARMSDDDEASAIFMGAAAPGQIVGGGRDRLTGGDVAGIVMSLMIAVGLVGGLGWWAWKRRRWMAEEERLLMRTLEDKAASVGSLHSQRGYGGYATSPDHESSSSQPHRLTTAPEPQPPCLTNRITNRRASGETSKRRRTTGDPTANIHGSSDSRDVGAHKAKLQHLHPKRTHDVGGVGAASAGRGGAGVFAAGDAAQTRAEEDFNGAG